MGEGERVSHINLSTTKFQILERKLEKKDKNKETLLT